MPRTRQLLKEKVSDWGHAYGFRGLIHYNNHSGNMATCRKGWGSTSLSPDPQVGHRGLAWAFETSASLQLHSSSNKTISPNLFQIVSLPNDKAFRTGALRAVVIQTTTGTLRIQRSLKRMCFPFHFPGDEDIKIYI